MIDFINPDETLNAREFILLAQKHVKEILKREKIPVLTSGTGFYLKAFLMGMYEVPNVDPLLRTKAESMEKNERYEELKRMDPEAASKLNPNDEYRVVRALEVNLSGVRWSERKVEEEEGFFFQKGIRWSGIFLDWSREELYARINQRSEMILESGFIEETEKVKSAYGEDCPALNSLGYNFGLEIINGTISLERLKEKFAQCHRNYAKKQITWFKKEKYLAPNSWSTALTILKKIETYG